MIRYNEDDAQFECYQDNAWVPFGDSGATAFDPETTMSAEVGAVLVPRGGTAQRPTPTNGMIRYNTTSGKLEMYQANTWVNVDSTGAQDGTFFGMPVFVASDVTGATDVSQELLNFMLQHDGQTTFVPAGIYKISIDSFGLEGLQPNASQRTFKLFAIPGSVIFTWPQNDYCIRWTGRAQSAYNDLEEDILSFAVTGLPSTDDQVTRIEVADASVYVVGEWVMIRSYETPEQDGNSSDIMDSYAESARVCKIDTDNDYLYLDRRLYLTYAATGGIEPSVVRFPRGAEGTKVEFSLQGITFDSLNDDYQDASGTQVDCVECRAVTDVLIQNCRWNRTYRAAAVFRTCPGLTFIDCTADNLPNKATDSHLGYALNLMCATADAYIDGYRIGKCRHGITTGGAVEPTRQDHYERWDQMGFPTNCVFSNLIISGANGSAIDAHAEGIGLHFKNCAVQFPNRGDGGQDSQGRGAYIRSADTIIEGYSQIGGSCGIMYSTRVGYTGHKIRHTINGATITNLAHSTGDAGAVRMESDTGSGLGSEHWREYSFNNLTIRDCDKGVDPSGVCSAVVNGLTTERVKYPFELGAGAFVVAKGVSTSFRGMSGGPFDVAALTAGSTLVIDDLSIFKGNDAGLPQFVFDGAGYYRLGRLTQINPDAVALTKIADTGITRLGESTVKITQDLTFDSNRPRAVVGRYITGSPLGDIQSSTVSADRLYLAPVYLQAGESFSDIAFASDTVTAGAYRIGLYATGADGLPTGEALIEETVTGITTATATNQDVPLTETFVVPESGWYWLAMIADVEGTARIVSSSAGIGLFGATDMTSVSAQVNVYGANYDDGLPDVTESDFAFAGGGAPFMGLKVVGGLTFNVVYGSDNVVSGANNVVYSP
jgi:hypothetical protein